MTFGEVLLLIIVILLLAICCCGCCLLWPRIHSMWNRHVQADILQFVPSQLQQRPQYDHNYNNPYGDYYGPQKRTSNIYKASSRLNDAEDVEEDEEEDDTDTPPKYHKNNKPSIGSNASSIGTTSSAIGSNASALSSNVESSTEEVKAKIAAQLKALKQGKPIRKWRLVPFQRNYYKPPPRVKPLPPEISSPFEKSPSSESDEPTPSPRHTSTRTPPYYSPAKPEERYRKENKENCRRFNSEPNLGARPTPPATNSPYSPYSPTKPEEHYRKEQNKNLRRNSAPILGARPTATYSPYSPTRTHVPPGQNAQQAAGRANLQQYRLDQKADDKFNAYLERMAMQNKDKRNNKELEEAKKQIQEEPKKTGRIKQFFKGAKNKFVAAKEGIKRIASTVNPARPIRWIKKKWKGNGDQKNTPKDIPPPPVVRFKVYNAPPGKEVVHDRDNRAPQIPVRFKGNRAPPQPRDNPARLKNNKKAPSKKKRRSI